MVTIRYELDLSEGRVSIVDPQIMKLDGNLADSSRLMDFPVKRGKWIVDVVVENYQDLGIRVESMMMKHEKIESMKIVYPPFQPKHTIWVDSGNIFIYDVDRILCPDWRDAVGNTLCYQKDHLISIVPGFGDGNYIPTMQKGHEDDVVSIEIIFITHEDLRKVRKLFSEPDSSKDDSIQGKTENGSNESRSIAETK